MSVNPKNSLREASPGAFGASREETNPRGRPMKRKPGSVREERRAQEEDIQPRSIKKRRKKRHLRMEVPCNNGFAGCIYIPMPMPPPAGIGGVGSLMVETTDSVVRSVEATLVAF